MRKLLLLISIIYSGNVIAQQTIFNEDFKNNNNKWETTSTDPDERAQLNSGRYDLETLSRTNWHYFTIRKEFDEKSGFTIESVITKLPRKSSYQKINIKKVRESLSYSNYNKKTHNSIARGLEVIENGQNNGVRFNLDIEGKYEWYFSKTPELYKTEDVSLAIGYIKTLASKDGILYSDEYYGIIWGCDGNTKLFAFNLMPEFNAFQVISLINGTWTTLIDWTVSDKILNGNAANKLTVASADGTLYFLINDSPVGKSPSQEFYGYNIGFFVGPETHISVDNLLIKGYSNSNSESTTNSDFQSSGTGFIISEKGYIVTNHHVISDAQEILVELNHGDKKKIAKAKVAVQDKNNDLVILKVDNELFPKPIYGFRTGTSDVGSSVFAMGFPLLSVLGDEIKITDGIISSKTGYQGDISTYQISAPIQPGNSGGPLFDKKGYLIGITNAGIPGAENIGYAIKSSYLQNLIELLNDKVEMSPISKLENSIFTNQIKELTKFVVVIKTK